MIYTDRETDQRHLDILNSHFEAVTAERHPYVMMDVIIQDAFDKVLGKNYMKERVSKRKEEKIRQEVIRRLRAKYGPYISLNVFKIKAPWDIKFATNFSRVYNVKGMGILYGAPRDSFIADVYLTAHSIERFEERCFDGDFSEIFEKVKKDCRVGDSITDLLTELIMYSSFDYGKEDGYIYLDIMVGFLVLQDLGDILVAKTFLTPDMVKERMEWYAPLLTPEEDKNIADHFQSLRAVLQHEPIKVECPLQFRKEMLKLVSEVEEE